MSKIKRKWILRETYMNCSYESCRMGCMKDGKRTKLKPHGPYYALYRRTHNSEKRKFDSVRVGTLEITDAMLKVLNSSELALSPMVSVREQRIKFYYALRDAGYSKDALSGISRHHIDKLERDYELYTTRRDFRIKE